jgi:hypothetical protein
VIVKDYTPGMDERQKVPDVTLPAGFSEGDELLFPDGRRKVYEGGRWVDVSPDPPEVVTGGEPVGGFPPWYEDPANDWVD